MNQAEAQKIRERHQADWCLYCRAWGFRSDCFGEGHRLPQINVPALCYQLEKAMEALSDLMPVMDGGRRMLALNDDVAFDKARKILRQWGGESHV